MARCLSLVLVACVHAAAVAAPPAITAVAYHPQGKSIAFGLHEQVRLFEAARGSALGTAAVPGRVTGIVYDPTGKWLAVACGETGQSGEVRLFAIEPTGRLAAAASRTIATHKDAIYALAFAPDGKTLATAGYDRLIHLWDITTPSQGEPVAVKPRMTLKDHSDTIYALAFNHDGTLLASGSADRSIKVWDAATGKRLYTLGDPTDWVYCLAWSPDKKHLVAGSVDKSVRIWAADRDGGKLELAAFAHQKPVWRLAYTDGGATLYSVGEDRVIKSWDAAKLTEKKVHDAQPDAILDFAIAPGGKQLAIARFDGVAQLLDPATGKSVAQLLPPKPVPPKAVRLAPTGVPMGKTTIVTVTGQDLDQASRVASSRQDVKVAVTAKTPESLTLAISVPAVGNAGATTLSIEGTAGKSALPLALDRFDTIAEGVASDSARAAQEVKLPATITGIIDRAGDADFYRFDAKPGDQIGVQVVAAEIGSKLDPVLVLTDAAGSVLAEGTTTLGYSIRKPGAYSLGIRDREYRGAANFTYRLQVGDVSIVTGVFPLAVQRGRSADIHLDGVNLGSATRASLTVPADAAIGSRIAVPVPKHALGKPEITVVEFPSVVLDPLAGADLRVPGSADGLFTKPHEAHLARFPAKKGQRLAIEVLAQRAGSPVDPVIEILDASGKPVPRALLRSTAKTYTTFRDHDSVGPGIRLDTWNELAIDDYLYVGGELMRILALPKNPDDDCQFYQVAGQRAGFLGTTPAHHSQGSPMYKVEIHPPGKTFPPNGLPVFTLHYRNDDGGPGFGKDSFLLFDPPADGDYQVRVSDARGAGGPSHAYRVTVRPPKPDFSIAFNPSAPAVWKGGGIPIDVTITRRDGFEGPVRLKLDGLPAGFSAPESDIEAGHNTTAFTLFAESSAPSPQQSKLNLVARTTIDGKEVTREAAGGMPKLVEPGEIVARTNMPEVALRPGKESRFVVDITRNGKFNGRVPIEVRGLPHGVRVLNIGLNGILITERETSREVVLYAEPWVKPREHPIVVLAKVEGKNTDHAAKSVLLKIAK